MHLARLTRALAAMGSSAALLGVLAFSTAGVAAAGTGTIYVAPSGSMSKSGASCDTAKYATINGAIGAAWNGARIYVCKGSYHEMVQVTKAVEVEGHSASVNATGFDNGFLITHSWVEVDGFTVWGATGEGILAEGTPKMVTVVPLGSVPTGTSISHVSIHNNIVKNNNTGSPTSGYAECAASGQVPGDCGEGIHFMGVAWSSITNNTVTGNMGGILLTDELGPTHDNLVANNRVYKNAYDCGITMPSHNVGINPVTGQLLPDVGGVFRNTVRGNWIVANGLKGEGAGVLIASPAPVTAAYDNLVEHNYIAGNELAGFTLHTHAPGAYANGNKVLYNWIGNNNVGGDPDAGVFQTTGALVFAMSPLSITIRDNTIVHDHFGIWLGTNVTAASPNDNRFIADGINVFHQ